MAFRKFWRALFTVETETLLYFLATFHAVVTDAIDSFKFIQGELKDGDCYNDANEAQIGVIVHRRSARYSDTIFRFEKEAVTPHENATQLKSLFLKVSTQLH